jgi:hypothetical protein
MPKFSVRVCSEVWKYYDFEIEATSKEAAELKCVAMLDDDEFCWPDSPDDVDGQGWEIHDVCEIPNPEK